jgi:general secretion pathway protein D
MLYSPESGNTSESRETIVFEARGPFLHTSQFGVQRVGAQLLGAHRSGAKEAQSTGMSRRITSSLPNPLVNLFANLRYARALQLLLPIAGLVAIVPAAAHAQSAGTWDKRGQQAELHEDFDTAYEDYRKAHLKNPKDLRFKTHYDRMRFQAAVSHVERGRVLRLNGDTTGALGQFTRALQIDPGNDAARQEIEITQRTSAASGGPGPEASATRSGISDQAAVLRSIGEVAPPIVLQPTSNDLITINTTEDVKNIYMAICKMPGFNVIFDPDYTSKRISIDLKNVSVADALRLLGTISGTSYKAVTANTIYVFANTRQKHTDLDEQVVQTFYLTNPSQANDANEIQVAIRNLLGQGNTAGIYLVPSQNAIVMRATSDQLLLAQKLINDLDRPKAEVVVDVAILEVNRDKIRNLGITLPQSIGLTPQASSTTNTTSSTTSTTSTASTTTPSNFTLNSLGNLNATNFAVSVSGGTLNALMTDTDTRVLQNPSVRATDGQKGTLKVGSKIPTATGSYGAAAGSSAAAGLGIGVQTQFTYLDIGVNIDMTPTVHLDGEVSLKIKVEDLSQTGSVTISGVTEPIIGQRSVEQTIQLKDGEPALLAGILTKQNNSTNSGTPGLAEIPILKYLFGSQYRETQQDEVIFILIPHIVRESVLTRANTRAIDTGPGQSIELRRDPTQTDAALELANPIARPQPANPSASAANVSSAMLQQMRAQAAQPTPTTVTVGNGEAPPPPTPIAFGIQPPMTTQPVGSTFQMVVTAAHAADLFSVKLQAQFDPKVLTLVNVDTGPLFNIDGQPVAMSHREENGVVTLSTSRPPGAPGVAGNGTLCTLTFRSIAPGDSKVSLLQIGAQSSHQTPLPTVGTEGIIHVK